MDIEIIAKLLSPLIVAIVGAAAKRYFEARPKLISYLVHASAFPLQSKDIPTVHTHGIVIRNSGKKSAHNVRVGHAQLPQSYQIFPPVSHQIINGPNGSAEILIPILVPNEQVSISYLYFPPVTWNQINSYTKSDEGLAQIINVIPSPQLPRWLISLLWVLIFVGASSALYWVTLAIVYWVP